MANKVNKKKQEFLRSKVEHIDEVRKLFKG